MSVVPVILLSAFTSVGGLLFGYDTGTISGVIAMDAFLKNYGTIQPNGKLGLSSSNTSLIVSMLSLGTFFGALSGAPVSDILGRKFGLVFGSIVFMVGVALQTGMNGLPMLIAGRFIAGLGVGLISMLVPLYQSEAAPKRIRGALVTMYQLFITIGILLAAIVEFFTKNIEDTSSYKIPIGIQLAFGGFLAIGAVFIPESPRFLVKKGNIEGATRALATVRGASVDSEEVRTEIAEIQAAHEFELSIGSSTYADCFKGNNLKRTLIGILIQMWQQLTGVNFIFYYGTTFFTAAGVSNPFVVQVLANIVNVISTFPGLYLMDRLGRRQLLIYGGILMLVCQYIVAIVGTADPGSQAAGTCLVVFFLVYVFGFAASWGPAAWVLIGELYPLKIRGKAMSLATASNWLWNYILANVDPYLIDADAGNLGYKTGFVWGTTCVFAVLYVFFFVYETKGLSLEELDEMFDSGIGPRESSGYVPTHRFLNEASHAKEKEISA